MQKTGTTHPALFKTLWLMAMAATIAGELLPRNNTPMRWIAAAHIDDKTVHFAAYAMLAFIPAFSFRRRRGIPLALSMILLGIALEFGQRLVPSHNFEIADMMANALGVSAGIVLALLAQAWMPVVEPS